MINKLKYTVTGGDGFSIKLSKGQHLKVINTYGSQVVDTWVIAADNKKEFMSTGHCMELLQRIHFKPGDTLITNKYRPILNIISDTSNEDHDTLIAACSAEMFKHAGVKGYHRSCAENFMIEIEKLNVLYSFTPQPWNLFMKAPVSKKGEISYIRADCEPNSYVELKAEMDCIIIFSACPDDFYPTNGGDGKPRDVEIEVY